MDAEWRNAVTALADYYDNEEVAKEFYLKVLEGTGKCNADDIHALLETFTNREDYGVQEGVVSVLDAAPRKLYLPILLDYLPELVAKAPKWAIALISTEIHANLSILTEAIMHASGASKLAMVELFQDDDLLAIGPEAELIKRQLKNELYN